MLSALSSIAAWAAESPSDLGVVSASRRMSVGDVWDASLRLAGRLTSQRAGRSVGVATYVQGARIGDDAPMQLLLTTGPGFPGVPEDRILRLDAAARRSIQSVDPTRITPADPGPDDVVRVAYFHRRHAASEPGAEVCPTTEIEIVGPDHAVQPAGESGYVRVRTAAMATGYLGADGADPFHGFHDGWFYPGDLGVLHGRRLTLVGRDDELLNIGGQKVLGPRLEAAVMTVPGVREAAAGAVPDALGVPQLALAIAAESGEIRRTELTELIRQRGLGG